MLGSDGVGAFSGRVAGLLAVLCACAAPLAAQDAFGRGGVELGGFGGLFMPNEPDFETGETTFELEETPLFGGRLGYVAPFGLSLEGHFGYSPAELVLDDGSEVDLDALLYGGSLGWTLQLARRAQLYVSAGAGAVRWDPEDNGTGLGIGEAETDLDLHFGGGFKLFLTRSLALRLEARDHLLPDALSETRQALSPAISPEASEDLTHNLGLTAGLSLFFGGKADSDDDGVNDDDDACPNTPEGIQVDRRGCPLDEDADGVADYLDRCAGTEAGLEVDIDGCPVDSDGDGVADGADACSNTPRGAQVDARGCPVDSDGDGVADGTDQCPNTPAGARVDASGCPTDEDRDGVADGLDDCPNTPAGVEVDEAGCQLSEIEVQLVETGRVILHNVHFDFDEATLRPESRSILDEVGEVLVRHPELRIEIQGHTDAIGSNQYNQGLSDRRAQAVLDYLLASFPQLERTQYIARGYGESQPVATNETDEGRQLNRRVEFVVLEGPENIRGQEQRREP